MVQNGCKTWFWLFWKISISILILNRLEFGISNRATSNSQNAALNAVYLVKHNPPIWNDAGIGDILVASSHLHFPEQLVRWALVRWTLVRWALVRWHWWDEFGEMGFGEMALVRWALVRWALVRWLWWDGTQLHNCFSEPLQLLLAAHLHNCPKAFRKWGWVESSAN